MTMDEDAGPSHAGSPCHLIRSKERTVICNVIQKCVEGSHEGKLLAQVTYQNKRATIYTGASLRTGRIRKQRLDNLEGALQKSQNENGQVRRKLKYTNLTGMLSAKPWRTSILTRRLCQASIRYLCQ
jgi:hypothetical protein